MINTARLIFYLILIFILVACGKKGPVRPLDVNLPGPVQNAELRQRGNELLLSWQLPASNQDNTPLKTAPDIDIYRMLFDPNDDCPECNDHSLPRFTINPELPIPAQRLGDHYLLGDKQVAAGQGYRYRLVPRTLDGQNGQPLTVQAVFIEPPAGPNGFAAEPHDRSATLSWLAVEPEAGQELSGYQIYRRESDGIQPAQRLVQLPPSELKYEDLTLENGKQYIYLVRALLKQKDQLLESLPSAAITVIPRSGT